MQRESTETMERGDRSVSSNPGSATDVNGDMPVQQRHIINTSAEKVQTPKRLTVTAVYFLYLNCCCCIISRWTHCKHALLPRGYRLRTHELMAG